MKLESHFIYQDSICRFWVAENLIESRIKGETFIEIVTPAKNEKYPDSRISSNTKWAKMEFMRCCCSVYERLKDDNDLDMFISGESFQEWFNLFDGGMCTFHNDDFFKSLLMVDFKTPKLTSLLPLKYSEKVSFRQFESIYVSDNSGDGSFYFKDNDDYSEQFIYDYRKFNCLDMLMIRIGKHLVRHKIPIGFDFTIYKWMGEF